MGTIFAECFQQVFATYLRQNIFRWIFHSHKSSQHITGYFLQTFHGICLQIVYWNHLQTVHSNCYVHPPGGGYIIFAFSAVRCPLSDVRRPMSGVMHGFRSFKGKVLELLSPNLVCRLIGSVACLGLLLAVVPLLLTE